MIKSDKNIAFAFADINCNLGVRTKTGKLIFFKSLKELEGKLSFTK